MKQYLKIVQEQLHQKEAKVKDQLKVTHAAQDAVEAARVEYLQRHTDVEKLKTHRKEWEKQMQLELEKEEANESDEMGTARHISKKNKKRKETH